MSTQNNNDSALNHVLHIARNATTYDYNFDISLQNNDLLIIQYMLPRTEMTTAHHRQLIKIDKMNNISNYFTAILNRLTLEFRDMPGNQPVLECFNQWRLHYMNAVHAIKATVTEPEPVTIKAARHVEMATVLSKMESTFRISDSCLSTVLTINLNMTNRLTVTACYDDGKSGILSYTRISGDVEIPYELTDPAAYYTKIQSDIASVIDKIAPLREVYLLYTQWETSFVKQVNELTGLSLERQFQSYQ